MPVTAEAVHRAMQLDWCMVEGGHSVCLTEEGRAVATGVSADD
jgi:hypothetical protein